MLKFFQNTRTKDIGLPRALSALFGSAALVTLISAMPVAPAQAQGVPAGLTRLDPPQPSIDGTKLTEDQRAKVRSAYARSRKIQVNQ